jgi:arabinogalactan oligomer / maltooligosaccharide transport system permease protein
MSNQRTIGAGPSLRRGRVITLIFRLVVATIAIAFALYPILLVLSASLNPVGRLSATSLIPQNASLDNYVALFTNPRHPFHLWLWNSIKVSTTTSVLAVFITALAAYSFSRFRFRGRRNLLLGLILVQVFPNLLAIVALFLLVQQLGNYIPWLGLNTHGGLILIYLGGVMGINVWLMKGFFDSIPRELDESAMVDGATHWQIFTQIIFPLVRPIMAVIVILTFIGTFGDFLLASVMLQSTPQYTFMVGLYQFISGQFNEQWGLFAAGAIVGALPIVIVYLLLQDQIVSGLTAGSVKG